MPNNFSLAFAGQQYDRAALSVASPPPQSLTGPSVLDAVQAPLSNLGLALANASLAISSLTVEQERLRNTLESFNASLLKMIDLRQTQAPAGDAGKTSTAPASTQNARQAYDASTTRLSATVDKAQAPVVDLALAGMTQLVDGLNGLAEVMPKATAAITLLSAAIAPLLSGILGAVADKVFDKVAGRVLEKGAARIHPKLGELFSDSAETKKTDKPGKPGKRKGSPPNTNRRGSKNPAITQVEVRRSGEVLSSQASPAKKAASSFMEKASKATKLGSRVAMPLVLAGAAVNAVRGLQANDSKAVGRAVGSAVGTVAVGYGGMLLGRTVGTFVGGAIGSLIAPGAGTLAGAFIGGTLGGMIGGLAGNDLGQALGEKVGEKLSNTPDRLGSASDISKQLNSAQADNRQITFAPQINISAPEQASHQQLAALVVQQIEAQFSPLSIDNLLVTRRDAALTDGVA